MIPRLPHDEEATKRLRGGYEEATKYRLGMIRLKRL
jgi:hypothetical protein